PILRKNCLRASFTIRNQHVRLSDFLPEHQRRFSKLVDAHISGYYEETGPGYAAKLIELNNADEDREGIFTLTKSIRAVHVKGKLAGFTVITEKIGGAVKTGPTILLPKY